MKLDPKMRIKHYPGKAVMNDPAWLEMDIPNSARGLQYEASWLDAQRNLSSSSSSNSWDKYSGSSAEHQKIRGLEKNSLEGSDDRSLYAIPRKTKKGGSVRLKYHSDKCLSKINSINTTNIITNPLADDDFQVNEYYLPSQSRVKREHSFKNSSENEAIYDVPEYNSFTFAKKDEESGEIYTDMSKDSSNVPKPKPRTKVPVGPNNEQYRNVISDLEKQIKKSVRFNDKSTEISGGSSEGEKENSKELATKLFEEEIDEDFEEETQERVSEWIDQQNQYILDGNTNSVKDSRNGQAKEASTPNFEYSTIDKLNSEDSSLNRNDSGYYEMPKKVRQRLPPKNIYPSSSESDVEDRHSRLSMDSIEMDMYDIYKDDKRRLQAFGMKQNKPKTDENGDFLIPRPKLLVPVHSYAIRKRRTGNLLRKNSSVYDCGYGTLPGNGDRRGRSHVGKFWEKLYIIMCFFW